MKLIINVLLISLFLSQPSLSPDPNDPWVMDFRDQHVNPFIHKFAKQEIQEIGN